MFEVLHSIWNGRVKYSVMAASVTVLVMGSVFLALSVEASPITASVITLSNTVAEEPTAKPAGLPKFENESETARLPQNSEPAAIEPAPAAPDRLDAAIEARFGNPSTTVESAEESEWMTVRMRVTAYCPCPKCCGRFSDGICADGHKISWGDSFVASDKMYSFGTEMIIPGYNGSQSVKVRDRGRLIKGNRLDVFFNSHYQAKKWGVQYLDVKVRLD